MRLINTYEDGGFTLNVSDNLLHTDVSSYITFQTNSCDPCVFQIGLGTWSGGGPPAAANKYIFYDWGDGSTSLNNGQSFGSYFNTYHRYLQPGVKTIKASSESDIHQYFMTGSSNWYFSEPAFQTLVGTLDISNTNYLMELNVDYNPSLNNIIIGKKYPYYSPMAYGGYYTAIRANFCDLTGTLDVSGLSNLNHLSVYSNPNLNKVLLPKCSSSNYTYLLYLGTNNIIGTLDASGLGHIGSPYKIGGVTGLTCMNNNNLSKILLPNSSSCINTLQFFSTGLSGTLDVSNFIIYGSETESPTQTAGLIWLVGCPSLNEIKLPTINDYMTYFWAHSSGLTGVLDVSCMKKFAEYFSVYDNPLLTNITHPTTNARVTNYNTGYCNIYGTLNLSGLTGLGKVGGANNPGFAINGNYISYVTWPTSFAGPFETFYIQNNNLDVTSMDKALELLDNWYSSNPPTFRLLLGLRDNRYTESNDIPTDGSSNTNLLHLQSIFAAAGQTLTVTLDI